MTEEERLQKQERNQTWHCPACQGELKKQKIGMAKNKFLPLGIRACQECESTWFIQKLNR